jgi:hypothetical protein
MWELGWWSWVQTWDSLQGFTGLAPTREVLLEEVSGPHTLKIINFIYTHHYTIHYSLSTNKRLYTDFVLVSLFFSCLLVLLRNLSLSYYAVHSDDVMLPEPSVYRSFVLVSLSFSCSLVLQEAARHIAPSLRLFVPNSLTVCHPFEGCLSMVSSLWIGVPCGGHSSTAITAPFSKYARPEQLHGKSQSVPKYLVICSCGDRCFYITVSCSVRGSFFRFGGGRPSIVSKSSFAVLSLKIPYSVSSWGSSRLILFFPGVTAVPSFVNLSLSYYAVHSDDVMLPEPSVSRSFLYFPYCFKGRECSGSFFTWLVGWVTDTQRLLS